MMRDDQQAAFDIKAHNSHSDPFRVKIPSHNAGRDTVLMYCHGHILSKLALLPFYQNSALSQLYRVSLEALTERAAQHPNHEELVRGVVFHLRNWQRNMGFLGTWPYTRTAFNLLEQQLKTKKMGKLRQMVILERAMLEQNKQEWQERAQHENFEDPQLKILQGLGQRDNRMDEQVHQQQPQQFTLPQDLLLLDSDSVWQHSIQKWQEGALKVLQQSQDLNDYESQGVRRYLRRMKGQQKSVMIQGLRLRNHLFELVKGQPSILLNRWLTRVQSLPS